MTIHTEIMITVSVCIIAKLYYFNIVCSLILTHHQTPAKVARTTDSLSQHVLVSKSLFTLL